jgi:glucokinase
MTNIGLVADAGGTNVRFALVDADADVPVLQSPKKFTSKEFAGIAEAAKTYLSELGAQPSRAVFAVAGPVRDGAIHMTNLGWRFSQADVGAALGIARVKLINDFEAIALAVPHFGPADLLAVGPARTTARATVAIVGPGTGFGVAGGVPTDTGVTAIVSEGGHASFAPVDDVEIDILKNLTARFGRLSIERILSGPGLVTLSEAMGASSSLSPQEITAQAKADPASFCGTVFARFCAILGSVAGDIALVMGARGGVMIAGGILPVMREALAASAFRARFEAKGRFAGYMADIPTHLIVQDFAGLMGAAASLQAMRRS